MKKHRFCLYFAALMLVLSPVMAQNYDEKVNEVPDFVYGANPDYSLMQRKSGKMTRSAGAQSRPDHWNNAVLKYFPPIFSQDGPSCMGSSYVGYIFTNEINSYRGADGSLPENQYAIFFNWLLTNGGSSKHVMLTKVGNPNSEVYGGRTYSTKFGYQEWDELDFGWMQGYDKWYHTMCNRITGTASFPVSALEEEGREAIKNWVYNHNGDSDYSGGGLCYVTVGASAIIGNIGSTDANEEAGVVGKEYITCWGPTMNHALTIVGYDDRIEFDLDSNKVYGEADKDEVGAWVVMNSWGSGWSNGGWIYVPYKYGGITNHATESPWKPEIMYARKNYRPLRTLKIKMDYTDRREMSLAVGVSEDTTLTSPDASIALEHFKNVGKGYSGSVATPMLGRWIDGYHYEPMEFGYDITDITEGYDRSKPLKYFFVVNTTNYYSEPDSGHIYKCSVVDYEYDENGIEIPMTTTTVDVPGKGKTTILSCVVSGQAVAKPTNLVASDGKLNWQSVTDGVFSVEKYYIYTNGTLLDSVDASATTYDIDMNTEASYTVAAKYVINGTPVVSSVSNAVRIYTSTSSSEDNAVYEFKSTGFYIQGIFDKEMQEATIEFWLKPYTAVNYNQDIGPGWGTFYMHTTNGGAIYYGWNTSSGDRSSDNTKRLTMNEWKHIAVTIDGSDMTLFVNGIKVKKITSKKYSGLSSMPSLMFGWQYGINGQMDELRIWNKARTAKEILYNYKCEIANPTAYEDLLAYYKMDVIEENGETVLRDCAGGHHAHFFNISNATSMVDNTVLTSSSQSLSQPNFTYDTTECYAGGAVKFTPSGNVSANISAWSWDIPALNVNGLNIQYPTFTFPKAGEYEVTLSVKDIQGNVVDTTKTVTIEDIEAPVAAFDITETTMPVGDHFSFVNHSTGQNCTYEWSMPGADVETSNFVNAGATYTDVGEHEVTLKVTNSAGTSSITKTINTTIVAPSVAFRVYPYNVIKGDKIYLTDQSSYNPDTWSWMIESTKKRVNIKTQNSSYTTVNPGYYDVTLTASNLVGENTYTQKSAFIVSNADSHNGLQFGGAGQLVTMTNVMPDATYYFTIDWWMKPSELDKAVSITAEATKKTNSSTDTMKLRSNEEGVLTVSYTRSVDSPENYIIADEWHHYAVVFSLGKISFYRDGEKISASSTSIGATGLSFPGSFVLGDDETGMTSVWDELKIWGSALSKGEGIKDYCNQPIANVDSACTADNLLVYYNFDQSSGDVLDATEHHIDGVRTGFGPDGDAWVKSIGVFTLDFSEDLTPEDVTSKYLKNYKAPFYNTGQSINQGNKRFLELETETTRSPWVIENSVVTDTITTCVHVDTQKNYDLTVETEWSGFASKLYNHRLYQVVKLPAGWYTFSITNDRLSDSNNPQSSQLVVTLGDTLCGMGQIDSTLAYADMSDGSVSFVLNEESEVSLGIIYNMNGKTSMSVSEFTLTSDPVEILEGDNVTSVSDAVHKGIQSAISPEVGGVRVVSDEIITLKIYDTLGRCLFNEYVSGSKYIPLPKGIYIVNGKKIAITR